MSKEEEIVNKVAEMLPDRTTELYAEMVANGYCKFSEVPDEYKPGVDKLIKELMNPDAPLPPVTFHNVNYRSER